MLFFQDSIFLQVLNYLVSMFVNKFQYLFAQSLFLRIEFLVKITVKQTQEKVFQFCQTSSE